MKIRPDCSLAFEWIFDLKQVCPNKLKTVREETVMIVQTMTDKLENDHKRNHP